jgi:hypothetical protein
MLFGRVRAGATVQPPETNGATLSQMIPKSNSSQLHKTFVTVYLSRLVNNEGKQIYLG